MRTREKSIWRWKKWLFFAAVGGGTLWVLWIGIAGWRHNSDERSLYRSENEMRSFILPLVEFVETPFEEAMDQLIAELKWSSAKNWRWRLVPVEESEAIEPDTPITLRLQNVPLSEALRYTVKSAGGYFEYQGGRKIEVYPLFVFDQELVVRRYRVPERLMREML